MIDDSTLLRRFAAHRGEEEFAEIVRRHLGLVYRAALCRTNGDVHLAEDIAQDVFTALAQNAATVQHHPSLPGWLYVTTRHAAANAMRREQRRRARELEAVAMNEPPESAAPETDFAALRAELDRVLDELSEADRQAVLLRYFGNRPFAEIGAALRTSENAARMRVDRALERLHASLGRRGVTSTAAALAAFLAAQAGAAVPAGLATTVSTTALASAAGAGAVGAVTFVQFMSTTKAVAVIAGVLVCGALGTAIYQGRSAKAARAELANAEQRRLALLDEVTRAKSRAAEAEERARRSEAEGTAERRRESEAAARPEAVASVAPPSTAALAPVSPLDLAAKDPAYRKLFLEQQRTHLGQTFGRFYWKLGLSPQQIAEFEDAFVAQLELGIELAAAARAQGGTAADPALAGVASPSAEAVHAKLLHALGAEGFAAYLAWNESGTARHYADTLASQLYYTDTPLTAQQAERLTQLVMTHSQRGVRSGIVEGEAVTDWDVVLASATEVLSPPQLAKLKLTIAQNRIGVEMHALMMRLLAAQPGASAEVNGRAPDPRG